MWTSPIFSQVRRHLGGRANIAMCVDEYTTLTSSSVNFLEIQGNYKVFTKCYIKLLIWGIKKHLGFSSCSVIIFFLEITTVVFYFSILLQYPRISFLLNITILLDVHYCIFLNIFFLSFKFKPYLSFTVSLHFFFTGFLTMDSQLWCMFVTSLS